MHVRLASGLLIAVAHVCFLGRMDVDRCLTQRCLVRRVCAAGVRVCALLASVGVGVTCVV